MTRREKVLTAAVASAALLWTANRGWSAYQNALERNSNLQLTSVDKLADAQFAMARGQKARGQISKWRKQSLPTNREVAKSLYQDWLRNQLLAAGLEVKQLADRTLPGSADALEQISVEIRAQGTLPQLTNFLSRFYTAGILHRISAATLSPGSPEEKLTANFTVDAMILSDCARKDSLPEYQTRQLPRTADDYRKEIESRNLFAPFRPMTPEKSQAGNDPASDALISGLTYGDRGWRLDIRAKDSRDVKHFYEGDRVQFGKFEGKVLSLDSRRAVIETAGGQVEVRLGQSLSDAKPAPTPET
jgi:hypothetical protein